MWEKLFLYNILCQFDWIQNGQLYSGDVYSNKNLSALSLNGSADEISNYTCHWENSLGEARFKNFIVTYIEKTEPVSPEIIAIAVSVALAIFLLTSIVGGIRFYLFKVS